MLPGFWEHKKMYIALNHLLEQYPEVKREEAEIYCYYGNFSPCILDGGRVFVSYSPATLEKMEETVKYYNDTLNTKLRLVLTNNLLEEKHCNDQYSNIMLKICHNGKNEIVLNSTVLENYILQNYPNYELISSTTKCLKKDDAKTELNNNNYKFVCLDYNLNHNWEFLNSLTPEEKEKTEFLINPICGPACPQRKEHYRLNSLFSLNYGASYRMKSCEITPTSNCDMFNKAMISPDEIYNKYLKNDFKYFKLEGRTWTDANLAISCVNYLIKPEYQTFALKHILDGLK